MAHQDKQSWIRLKHIISMLKENRYPNHPRIVAALRRFDPTGTYHITQKTIQRDIDSLKRDYHAPIKYDFKEKGYYLTDLGWNLELPLLVSSDMEAAALSGRIAETILPNPIAGQMRKSLDSIFVASDVDIMDDRTSLLTLVATGSQVQIPPDIFEHVFKAWRSRHLLNLVYASALHGCSSHYLAEPHALAFHNSSWYLIVKVLKKNDCDVSKEHQTRSLVVHRIKDAAVLPDTFENDQKILADINAGKLFDFPIIHNVSLRLTENSIIYGREHFPHGTFTSNPDGSVTLHLEHAEAYAIKNFILSWSGKVTAQSPASLVEDIIHAAKSLLQQHQAGH